MGFNSGFKGLNLVLDVSGARGSSLGWGTALQAGRSRVSIPEGVIGIFSLTLSFRPHYSSGVDSASNRNKYQEYFLGCKGGRCVGLTNLTIFKCRLSWNVGTSNSWNPQGLSRPVIGLLYLYLYLTRCEWTVSRSSMLTIFETHKLLFSLEARWVLHPVLMFRKKKIAILTQLFRVPKPINVILSHFFPRKSYSSRRPFV